MHGAEQTPQIAEAEIIHVFVEHIEPGVVFDDPVEARHLDIDLPALVGRSDLFEETHRVADVFQHMAQHDGIGGQSQFTGERRLDHLRVVALIGGVDAGDRVAAIAQHLEEIALAAAHLDQLAVLEMPGDHTFDILQVPLELAGMGLFVLIVAVVAELVGVKGLIEDQAAVVVLHQHDIGAA